MSSFLLYLLASIGLFCLGLYTLLVRPHLLRKVLAFNVMGSGIFLMLVAVARRNQHQVPDPVPHAMVLTGIVVAVSATALALAIARRIARESGRTTLSDAEEEIE